MTSHFRPVLPLTLAVPLAISASPPGQGMDGAVLAQLSYRTYRERIVIRIPHLSPVPRRAAPPVSWDEATAPRCVPAAALASASISASGDVDLVATDGRRLRAKLDEDCPTLNFYTGFYLRPHADGMVCAKRDVLRSRSGARCGISRFRTLVAKK